MSAEQSTGQADQDLLRRMRAGDEDAFLTLYGRCQGPIYRYALHMSGSSWIAEDVTQEVFLNLIEGLDRFDASRGTLAGYLFGIGRKLLLRRLEKDRVYVNLPGEDDREAAASNGHAKLALAAIDASRSNTAPGDPVRHERIERVRQAVLTLPANYREVVVLCDLQELNYDDAAKVIGCAVGTIRSRLHRARALLTGKLREFGPPEQGFVAGALPKMARNAS